MNGYYAPFNRYLQQLDLTDDIINEIMRCHTVREYKKGESFASIDELSNSVGFVVSGLFFMYTINQDGTFFTKEFIKNGQFLLASFDPEKESTVSIQSIKDSIILEAKYSDVKNLLFKYHEIEVLSKKRMENELESIYQRMTQYATKEATDRYMLFKKEFGEVEEEIPQFLIASYLGITPTQLSRIRAKLKF